MKIHISPRHRQMLRQLLPEQTINRYAGVEIMPSPMFPIETICSKCNGTGGGVNRTFCDHCKGQGRLRSVGAIFDYGGTLAHIINEPLPKAFEIGWPTDVPVPLRSL